MKKLVLETSLKAQTKGVIHSSTGTFREEVLQSNVPVVVDFYADWCGPCRMGAPIVERLSQEFDGKVRFVKVNVDTNGELAEQYGVQSIPTMVFFKNGKEVNRLIGAASKDYYRHHIEHVLLDGGN